MASNAVNTTWLPFNGKEVRNGSCYLSSSKFIADLKADNIPESFRMTEEVFQELIGKVAMDRELACLIDKYAVVLAMRATGKDEIKSLLEMAESFANG